MGNFIGGSKLDIIGKNYFVNGKWSENGLVGFLQTERKGEK
ncbi:hypothetical protein SAMN04488116_1425 [Flagellimonas flava]|uniref:Uncharacterized protein n=1 Tax=Flagellimonas flava TaxID=570519 RepID=A0A1M5K7V5_9FLAO|nr:hypothetical protein SAMN04488116_1425 [Allomuricauda flava]